MKKNVLIAFTSGADSTLLLELALKAGHDATVFYVTVENNKEKARIELEQTQKIITHLEEKYNTFISTNYTANLTQNRLNICTANVALSYTQALIWPLFAMFNSDIYCDEVWFGYHQGDDILSHLQEVINLYNAYKPFKLPEAKFPELVFPLLEKNKTQILSQLSQDLLPLIYPCEDPRFSDDKLYCGGACASCNKYNKLRQEWDGEYNPFDHTKLIGLPNYYLKMMTEDDLQPYLSTEIPPLEIKEEVY